MFTGSNARKLFLYLLNIIQASCMHFASLRSISVGSCEHRHVSWEHKLLHVFHQQSCTKHRNTDLQLLPKQDFFEWRHNSAGSSSKWWHCCSWFDWHGCSRDAKHRRCSSSALISAANNLLPQWTEVPNATGTPSIHATGNSLNDLSFPVTQEITTLSHHHICLLIVGGVGADIYLTEHTAFTASSSL